MTPEKMREIVEVERMRLGIWICDGRYCHKNTGANYVGTLTVSEIEPLILAAMSRISSIARDEALEAAANVCDNTHSGNLFSDMGENWPIGVNDGAIACAERIRTLRTQPEERK